MSQVHASVPLAAYGALGLPLAMAALPVYVQAPAYYAGTLGLPLATTGVVLFAARLVDTVQDPWLGRWIDRLAGAGRLHGVLWAAAAGLANRSNTVAALILLRLPEGISTCNEASLSVRMVPALNPPSSSNNTFICGL